MNGGKGLRNLLIIYFICITMLFSACSYFRPGSEAEGTKPGETTAQTGKSETGGSETSGGESEPSSGNSEPGESSGQADGQPIGQPNEQTGEQPGAQPTGQPGEQPTGQQGQPSQPPVTIDYEKIKPNEAGKIMVVMFHNFIEEYKGGDKEYTMTLDAFEELLHTLYDKGYRLISLDDYVNNRISTPAGYIPIVFTFDDGTPGQFSLVETEDGLKINERTAAGIMLKFAEKYPDFGVAGTFFVYLAGDMFKGAGTLQQRLQVLTENGFDIGNHTLTHTDLLNVKDANELQKLLGGNNARLVQLMNGLQMRHFSLPFGNRPSANREYLVSGEYEGISYYNASILLVGAEPYFSPVSRSFNPHAMSRVRSPGMIPVDCDLSWWLERLSKGEQYVSDGDPDTVVVPVKAVSSVDPEKLGDKKLITY
jgi:hypothetical protein